MVPYVTVGGFGDNKQLLHQLTEADPSPKTALSQYVAIWTSAAIPRPAAYRQHGRASMYAGCKSAWGSVLSIKPTSGLVRTAQPGLIDDEATSFG
jgi:hypothetical protein